MNTTKQPTNFTCTNLTSQTFITKYTHPSTHYVHTHKHTSNTYTQKHKAYTQKCTIYITYTNTQRVTYIDIHNSLKGSSGQAF